MTISEDGEIVGITAENKPITIEISKQDVYGEELSGAEMELINSDEETVENGLPTAQTMLLRSFLPEIIR